MGVSIMRARAAFERVSGHRLRHGRRASDCTCAATPDQPQPQPQKRTKLPERGFFATADTKGEVYSPLAGVNQGSIYKRGGRWAPEFLWNTNWKDQLELEESVQRRRQEAEAQPAAPAAGGLGMSRLAQLDSLDVDLSAQLQPRKKQEPEAAAAAMPASSAAAAAPAPAMMPRRQRAQQAAAMQQAQEQRQQQRGPSAGSYPQMPPRRGEAQRWQRSKGFAKRSSDEPTTPEQIAAQAATVAAERAAYARYKEQLLVATVALGATLSVAGFVFYSKDVAASYTLGAVASIIYLRMLNRSIDAVGGADAGAALSQPRLLIPIILAMSYNRWNVLAADTTGVTLQLMPILLGFLTYKGAVITRGAADLFSDLAGSSQSAGFSPSAEAAAEDGQTPGSKSGADEVIISRDYANRILQG